MDSHGFCKEQELGKVYKMYYIRVSAVLEEPYFTTASSQQENDDVPLSF